MKTRSAALFNHIQSGMAKGGQDVLTFMSKQDLIDKLKMLTRQKWFFMLSFNTDHIGEREGQTSMFVF